MKESKINTKIRKIAIFLLCFLFTFLFSCTGTPASKPAAASTSAQDIPLWVNNLEKAFPPNEWIAAVAQNTSQQQAESSAISALARTFKTDVESITQATQSYSQIVSGAKGGVDFKEGKEFSQNVNTYTNVHGLIGVQVEVFRARDRTVYANARMNRKECAARYSGMINENTAVINKMIAFASGNEKGTFEAYSRLNFALAIAQVNDNFQNILEVLDPGAINRKPAYGGAIAIKSKMLECAALITVGIAIDTEQSADKTLLTRAAGSLFRDLGFKTNENGQGKYVLRANVRFEEIVQSVISCRYYLNAAIENSNKTSVFSFTDDERMAHPNASSEARRLALRGAETSLKEGKFAKEFDNWLNSLLD